MQKVLMPHPAVLEYNRLENSYNRAMRNNENLNWWLDYYKMRTTIIAKHHGLDEDDLINQWIDWQKELKLQAPQ